MFNKTRGINKSKVLTNNVSCKCKCRNNGRKFSSDQWWNNDRYWCKYKKHHVCEKVYIGNPSTFICEKGKYFSVFIDNSVITCDEIKDKTAPRSFKEKKQTVAQSFYILLGLFLITLAFLRARK